MIFYVFVFKIINSFFHRFLELKFESDGPIIPLDEPLNLVLINEPYNSLVSIKKNYKAGPKKLD